MKKAIVVLLVALTLCACLCACGAAQQNSADDVTLPTAIVHETYESTLGSTLHITESVSKNGGKRKNTDMAADYTATDAQDVRFTGTLDEPLVFDVSEATDDSVRITLKNGAYVLKDVSGVKSESVTDFVLTAKTAVDVALVSGDNTGIYTFSFVKAE